MSMRQRNKGRTRWVAPFTVPGSYVAFWPRTSFAARQGVAGSERANRSMIAALSDRRRWGISVGESLGHHKGNRNIGRRGDELAGMGLMAAAPCPGVEALDPSRQYRAHPSEHRAR